MVYKINDIEYVLVNVVLVEEDLKKISKMVDKNECIMQDFEIMRCNLSLFTFLFGSRKLKIKIFVPSKNIIQFDKELYERKN
jgi:hypothetical protein